MLNIVIISFYHFAEFPDFKEKQKPWLEFCKLHNLKGTILLASEGINSTISGTRENIDALLSMIKSDARFKDLKWKENIADFQPFERMKVRLKEEIVRMGVKDLDIENYAGTYISPKDWDEFISKPDVKVIDTRNDYEVKIGTFEGAINPDTQNFREFPDWVRQHLDFPKETPIGMFCTGGIRCEKSTAYLKTLGYKNVYHLEGGILQYLEDTRNKNKKWIGECFVFDDRVAVNEELAPSGAVLCEKCGNTMTTDELRLAPKGRVFCGNCNKTLTKV